jgi:hypothetical protein
VELKAARETGLFSCRVEIGEFFAVEKHQEWVLLREATAGELSQMAANEGKDASSAFMKLLPTLIKESSFTVEGKPATPGEVADIIMAKGTLYSYVITEWQAALPLPQRKSTKSGK